METTSTLNFKLKLPFRLWQIEIQTKAALAPKLWFPALHSLPGTHSESALIQSTEPSASHQAAVYGLQLCCHALYPAYARTVQPSTRDIQASP